MYYVPVQLFTEIYKKYQLGPACHMTHIDNVPSILAATELRSYNQMRGQSYYNLANEDVQFGRSAKVIPITGRALHDYVPLYFGNRTPMVAVNQTSNENLVFIRFSLNLLANNGVVITDGNARSSATQFRSFTQLSDLDFINPKAINSVKYAHSPELKRQKQAEILVPERLSLDHALEFICYSTSAQQRLLVMFVGCGKKFKICVSPGNWYFNSQHQGNP